QLVDRADGRAAVLDLSVSAPPLGKHETAEEALQEALELARDLGHAAFLADALIVAAARIASGDPDTAAALVAVADRARRELMLELDPVELGVRAAVENELRGTYRIDLPGDASEDD